MIRKICAAALAACMFTVPVFAEQAPGYDIVYSSENPIPEIAENVRPAIVQITGSVENWDPVTRTASVQPYSSGSGSYIKASETEEGGYILTNYHIVQETDVYSITWLSGEEMDAELVGYDDGTDIAVLRFSDPAPADVSPIPLGDSDALRIGELAICIGNPGSGKEVLFGTVTAGIISGLNREDINASNFTRSIMTIQTDAAINTGNSGGALLNAKGELVGIPTLKFMYSYSTVYEGLGFCVPINAIRSFIDQIIEKGSVTRPRLGITVNSIDGPDEPMRRYPPCGAQVYTVDDFGPSAKVGIKPYDIITEVNGVRVKTYVDLIKEVDRYNAGDILELKVYRYFDENGELTGTHEELTFSVKLEMLD